MTWGLAVNPDTSWW